MKIRYVGPSAEITVEIGGVSMSCPRGHDIDVPPAIAGSDPDPRLEEAMGELHQAINDHDHLKAVGLREEIAGLDAGEGLLAQAIWESAEPKVKKAAADPKD